MSQGLSSGKSSRGPAPNSGADWQSLVYPESLYVHNTFLDVKMSKPLSIAEFFQERQVRSAPGSRLSTNSEASRTYCPGQVLTETALLSFASCGDALPSIVENSVSTPSQWPVKRASGQAVKDHEAGSDCSTADTADDVRTAVRLLIPSLDGTAQGLSPRTEKIGVPAPSVPPVQLRLEDVLSESDVVSDEVPTQGSRNHHLGTCQPCAFVYKEEGCKAGVQCRFCHLCGPEARRQRKKEKQQAVRNLRRRTESQRGSQ